VREVRYNSGKNGEKRCLKSSKVRSPSSPAAQKGSDSLLQSFSSKEGAYVFITGRRQNELDAAVKTIGTNVSGVQGDVARLAGLDRLYQIVSKEKGRIDVIFATPALANLFPLALSPKSTSTNYSTLMCGEHCLRCKKPYRY